MIPSLSVCQRDILSKKLRSEDKDDIRHLKKDTSPGYNGTVAEQRGQTNDKVSEHQFSSLTIKIIQKQNVTNSANRICRKFIFRIIGRCLKA